MHNLFFAYSTEGTDMYTELVKEKLLEQSEVYQVFKNGDTSSVQYRESKDKEWGTSDANYLNRMRLSYYLLYAQIDDENTVAYLFQEELKDRKSNSFQGIGNALYVLTSILKRYNNDGRYNGMLEEAGNVNFDCACGYDKNAQIDDEIGSLDLMDCIFLSQDLEYRDVMEVLVNQWKESITDWTDADRKTLIGFHSFLGKEQENEAIYKILLENAVTAGEIFNIVFAYNNLIRYYLNMNQFETAGSYLQKMIAATDFKEIEEIHLFKSVLEECFEIICGEVKAARDLWEWAKPYMQKSKNRYGNLYTKAILAAQTIHDDYAVQLEQEYRNWKNA